jgi:chromosome segregation ATPase
MLLESLNAKDGWVAGVGAIFGGILLKLLDRSFQVRDSTNKEETDLRKELRDEVRELRTQLSQLSAQLDSWKEKYFAVLADNTQMKSRIEEMSARQVVIQKENQELLCKNKELLAEVRALRRALRGEPDEVAED